MHPPVSSTVVGDLATEWRHFAAVTIVQPVEVATHLRELTDPLLLPTRCRLFRRARVPVARDHVEVRPDKDLNSRMFGKGTHHWRTEKPAQGG